VEQSIEPDPNFLGVPYRELPEPPFGVEFDPGQPGVLNAIPAEEFPEKVSDDVEGLLFLGHLTDQFNAYGHEFAIKTLKRGEKLVVAKLVAEYESTIGLGDAISAATVAACLTVVDGRPLALPLPGTATENFEQVIRQQFAIVLKWYDPVVDLIYDKYMALFRRQQDAFLEFSGK